MSGYIFNQIPKLKEALTKGNLQLALKLVPVVDIEDDEHEYVVLIIKFQEIFLQYCKDDNQLAIFTTINLIAKSEHLYYSEDWPQFTDLISNLVGAIAGTNNDIDKENMLDLIMRKLPPKDPYVANHGNLNFNLACYFAEKEDVKTMMEYVLRASFYYEAEKFFNDSSFGKYKEESFFKEPLEKLNHALAIWWTSIWPIEEWYEVS